VLSAKGYVVLCIRTSLQNIYTLSILIQARTQLSQQFACNPYKVNGTLFGHGFTPLKPHWTYYTENKEQKQNAKTRRKGKKTTGGGYYLWRVDITNEYNNHRRHGENENAFGRRSPSNKVIMRGAIGVAKNFS
jgi:hypothetical protein